MNRRFRKIRFPYDPMHYQGIKGFRPDAVPHSQKCQCAACRTYLELIAVLNPERIAENEVYTRKGETPSVVQQFTYVRNAQVLTAEDRESRKSRLHWNDPNRPYELENRQKSGAKWLGTGLIGFKKPVVPVPVSPVPVPAVSNERGTGKRDNRTAREKRLSRRQARIRATNAKQVVVSAIKPRVALVGHYRRNGLLIGPTIEQGKPRT